MDYGAPLGIALLGLALGMRHAADPDHVIAVTTILGRERRIIAATRVGLVWGLGHATTVLGVGTAIIVFKIAIPARVGLAMEFAVALVLIALGMRVPATIVRRLLRRGGWPLNAAGRPLTVHSHPHSHEGRTHRHPHVHASLGAGAPAMQTVSAHDHFTGVDAIPPTFATPRSPVTSFGIGLVHGLAGSAALALLVLAGIPQPLWATLYLAVFCAGTILGMTLITTAIGAPLIMVSSRTARFHRGLVMSSSLLSLGFGLFLAYQIGVVDHLLAGKPSLTPH